MHEIDRPPSGRRRRLLAAVAAVGVGAALSARARAGAHDSLHEEIARRARALAGGRDLRLRLLLPQGSGANVAPIIEAFTAASGVVVEPLEAPVDDIDVRLTLDTLAGRVDYDLALPATFSLPDLVAAGAIVPIGGYAARHEPAGFRDDILYTVGDAVDGELYGFQTDGDAYTMFYHAELLGSAEEGARYADRHGKPLGVPLTWEELDRQMAFFHRPEEKLYGGLLFRSSGYLVWEWWARFHAKGVWPLSPTLEPQIDGDAGVEALEEMIRASDHLAPGARTFGLFDNWKRYARGDVYCNIGWGGTQKYLHGPHSPMRGRLAHGPLPGGEIDGETWPVPYFNWGWNYVVTAASSEPELAYLFALFAAAPEMSTRSVRVADGFFDPFRLEHYADAGVRASYGEDFLAVHEASLRTAIPDLYLARRGEYFGMLGEWLERAFDGRVSPAKALGHVADGWRPLVEHGDRARQTDRWRALRASYPAELQRRLRDLA